MDKPIVKIGTGGRLTVPKKVQKEKNIIPGCFCTIQITRVEFQETRDKE